MKAYHGRSTNHVAFRAQRLDPQQETRRSLALVVLMSLATLSVMATTQALSAQDPAPVHGSSQE